MSAPKTTRDATPTVSAMAATPVTPAVPASPAVMDFEDSPVSARKATCDATFTAPATPTTPPTVMDIHDSPPPTSVSDAKPSPPAMAAGPVTPAVPASPTVMEDIEDSPPPAREATRDELHSTGVPSLTPAAPAVPASPTVLDIDDSPPPAPKATRDALHSTVIPTLLFGGQSEVGQSLESTTDRAQGSPAELPSDKPLPGSARPPIDSNTRLENDGAATRQPPRPKLAGRLKMTRETMRSRRTLRDVTNVGASEAGVGKGAKGESGSHQLSTPARGPRLREGGVTPSPLTRSVPAVTTPSESSVTRRRRMTPTAQTMYSPLKDALSAATAQTAYPRPLPKPPLAPVGDDSLVVPFSPVDMGGDFS